MTPRTRLVFFLCTAALLWLPAGAVAKPGYVVKVKDLDLHLEVPASNGYEVSVDTDGHRQIVVSVEKGGFFASYITLGRVSRKGIEADLGKLGQISLRFRGKKRLDPGQPGLFLPKFLRLECKGRRTVRERGIFRGNLRFEGERGFTRAVAHRVKGKVVRSYKRVCKRNRGARASKAKSREELVSLEAAAEGSGRFRLFNVLEVTFADGAGKSREFTIAITALREKPDRVNVVKGFFLISRHDSVEIGPRSERPVSAEVSLPKPFEGTASYLDEGTAAPSWTGSFGVRLPGSGLVPMAGPEFEAALCRASTEFEFFDCLDSELAAREFRAMAPTPTLWRWPGSPR